MATRAKPGQRTRRSAAAEKGSKASVPSTTAVLPPEVVTRAIKARNRLLPPEDQGPTISLSCPGGKAPSKPLIPRAPHPGGGKDSDGKVIGSSVLRSKLITQHLFSLFKTKIWDS